MIVYISVVVADYIGIQEGTSDPQLLRNMIRRSVIDIGRRGKDDVFGYGMVREGPTCDLTQAQSAQHDQ